MRLEEVLDRMNVEEKATLTKILREAGGEVVADLCLEREMKRHDYAYVLD